MFLLLLMELGAAGVKAQVRIGGNGAPNAAAVLDLNATDATNNGTKGLALPRVDLTSTTMQLTSGVANLTGMLVYNTTTTLGMTGVYYWNGNSWILASLPSTSDADSGAILMSNGTLWTAQTYLLQPNGWYDTVPLLGSPSAVSWSIVYQGVTVLRRDLPYGRYGGVTIPGLLNTDLCIESTYDFMVSVQTLHDAVIFWSPGRETLRAGWQIPLRCYRPSL